MRKKAVCIALAAMMASMMLTGCRESPVLDEMADIYYSSTSNDTAEDEDQTSDTETENDIQENTSAENQ